MSTIGIEKNSDSGILLLDDGELDDVVAVLETQGLAFDRICGGEIPAEMPAPRDLMIVTPRLLDCVRPHGAADARPGRPLRIIAVEDDSPAMRRRLRRAGLDLLVRLPATVEIWRLLISRALYRGQERREDFRVAVGSALAIDSEDVQTPVDADSPTTLLDLSNRGCRLHTRDDFMEGDPIQFGLPPDPESIPADGTLRLAGEVRRITAVHGSDWRTLAVVFESNMPEETRTGLTALINRWSSGPDSGERVLRTNLPTIPPCDLASLPDLTLDDETDPPIPARSEIRVQMMDPASSGDGSTEAMRRTGQRGRFESSLRAETKKGPVVVIGRDLSARGMRIERIGNFRIGDRFSLALHGPGRSEPLIVAAEITRDDGNDGFALIFDRLDRESACELEKLVACLPDVESLDESEIGGLGAVLSEILVDE